MNSWLCIKTDAQNGPAWKAILLALEKAIDTGIVRTWDLLSLQRLMADFIGVYVNTVNRAMREAAGRGLIAARTRRSTIAIAQPSPYFVRLQ